MIRPSSLYVHIPFCTRVCPYCAFNVTSHFDAASIERFLDAISLELERLDSGRALSLRTAYVGGGTPTVLDASQMSRLLAAILRRCDPAHISEWTVEMNPGTVDAVKARVLKEAGVTRVSLGAQSMQKRFLQRLGRTHTAEDVRRSVDILRDSGFSRINVDLIYAQPEQTVLDWIRDVESVLELGVSHLSLYELTFESGTPFGRGHTRGSIVRAEDSLAVAMFSAARERLSAAGIEWYEISNFAIPGHESEHNRTYWRNEPYWGVGPGAFGCIDGARTMNANDVAEWQRLVETTGSGVGEREPLSAHDTFIETLAAGLRTRDGVRLDVLHRRTGLDVMQTHRSTLDMLRAKGLAEWSSDRLWLTLPGVLVLDAILLEFLD